MKALLVPKFKRARRKGSPRAKYVLTEEKGETLLDDAVYEAAKDLAWRMEPRGYVSRLVGVPGRRRQQ